jgi:6,7-dimethyl-8-ribityllumazine synthase
MVNLMSLEAHDVSLQEAEKSRKSREMDKQFPTRPSVDPKSSRAYAIVASEFNRDLVQSLADHATAELISLEPDAVVDVFWVPGSFEIPLFVQAAAKSRRYDALLALGLILQGETSHASLIADAVTKSLLNISLEFELPVIHEVLLVNNMEQAQARCMGTEHNRGVEAAKAAVSATRNLLVFNK